MTNNAKHAFNNDAGIALGSGDIAGVGTDVAMRLLLTRLIRVRPLKQ